MITTPNDAVPNYAVPLKTWERGNGMVVSEITQPCHSIPNSLGMPRNGKERRERIAKKYPKTAAQFLKHIERELDSWRMAIEPAEQGDESQCRVVFWLASDTERRAYLAHEFGRMIVTVAPGKVNYWFELDRLNENHTRQWSWQKQLSEKTWCEPEHIELLDSLCRLYPVTSEVNHA